MNERLLTVAEASRRVPILTEPQFSRRDRFGHSRPLHRVAGSGADQPEGDRCHQGRSFLSMGSPFLCTLYNRWKERGLPTVKEIDEEIQPLNN
jgi:hypothetical protein